MQVSAQNQFDIDPRTGLEIPTFVTGVVSGLAVLEWDIISFIFISHINRSTYIFFF